MTPRACMGGWCALRDRCPHHNEADRSNPAERLCLPGQDGVRESITGQGALVVLRMALARHRAFAAAEVPA